jgi:hypothetical protein
MWELIRLKAHLFLLSELEKYERTDGVGGKKGNLQEILWLHLIVLIYTKPVHQDGK